jgi:hypothetical protein
VRGCASALCPQASDGRRSRPAAPLGCQHDSDRAADAYDPGEHQARMFTCRETFKLACTDAYVLRGAQSLGIVLLRAMTCIPKWSIKAEAFYFETAVLRIRETNCVGATLIIYATPIPHAQPICHFLTPLLRTRCRKGRCGDLDERLDRRHPRKHMHLQWLTKVAHRIVCSYASAGFSRR